MFELEDSHFWFVGKHYFIDSVLSKYKNKIHNILDLGSGTGGATKFLQRYGKVTGIENYDYAITLAKKRGLDIKKGDLNKFRVKDNSFDLITILDVFYHKNIKEESGILKKCNEALKKNGYLLIADSALDILKSYHDIVTQGARRYSLTQMSHLVENQGFKILKASYIYFFLFPLLLINRFISNKLAKKNSSDVSSIPPIFNFVLTKIVYFESKLLRVTSFPIGSSVIILARKK
jgi:SAM-dependent methyltransferase